MILGIDTSNYTTSAALMSSDGELLAEARKLLTVADGKRGLRQSKALFQHINNLPRVINQVAKGHKDKIGRVVVSTKPRPGEESYMPVFKAGISQAETLAGVLGVRLIKVSHQEGHLKAGIWSAGFEPQEFLALHISGGTTELLEVTTGKGDFKTDVLADTLDISAGQFIDRVGVKLGLSFPAGPELEQLATTGADNVDLPVAVKDYQISFSGPCSAAMRLIEAGNTKKNDLALAVQSVIYKSLAKVLKKAVKERGLKQILIVGGVAANKYLKDNLKAELEDEVVGARLYFAEAKYSTDNAVGVAALGLD